MADNKQEKSIFDMSDEDFLNAAPPTFPEEREDELRAEDEHVTDPEAAAAAAGEDGTAADDEAADGDASADPDAGEEAAEGSGDPDDAGEDEDPDAGDEPGDKDKDNPDPKDKSKDKPKGEDKTDEIDYKAAYERLTAPFKANGREIQVKSIDDAIALMQMGANYNKKMAALKPNLKILKMLENNQLLDEEKISFLIDLDKKDPAAINKLISDSKIDPMELDAEKGKEYRQSHYSVSDKEIELDMVLEEIKDSPAYSRTLDIVAKEWDAESKRVIGANPGILKILNSHVEEGFYDIISAEVESERLFGRLNGLSDLEAYRQVGEAIQARGGFNHLIKGRSHNQKETPPAGTVVEPKPKKGTDDKLKDKRRAASSTKSSATEAKVDFNPLSMSDEEFEKVGLEKFL